jgi:hypothetical protein
MHLEADIERVWKCIWRCVWKPNSRNAEMHLVAVIELNSAMHIAAAMVQVWRCNWRKTLSNSEIHCEAEIKFNSEMHLEVVVKRV